MGIEELKARLISEYGDKLGHDTCKIIQYYKWTKEELEKMYNQLKGGSI